MESRERRISPPSILAAGLLSLAMAIGCGLEGTAEESDEEASPDVPGAALSDEFGRVVTPAVESVFPDPLLVSSRNETLPDAEPGSAVTVSAAFFNLGERSSVLVMRHLGAAAPVRASEGARAASSPLISRPGAGERRATYVEREELRSLAWTERPGVTFQIVALGDVRASDLTTLASRLPQESSLPPAAYGRIGVGSTANDAALRSASDLFIAGADAWTDDLNDEATLSRTSYRHSNYAGIWQMVLAVDQYQNLAEFDCDFGPMTESRTTGWQVDHRVPDRGAVRLATRQNAQSRLEQMFGVADGSDYGVYLGYWMYIFIHRHGPNIAPAYRWDVENIYYPDPDGDGPLIGDWHGAAYTYANFKGC